MEETQEINKSKSKQKAIILVAILILSIAAIATGIMAYLTSTKTATNVFTIGNVRINLTEGDEWDAAVASGEAPAFAQGIQPGQAIEKEPVIENVGANPAYVYLKVYVPVNNGEDLFTYTINETDAQNQTTGWTKRDEDMHTTIDGQVYNIYTYEYDEVLEPGTETTPLFGEVIFAEEMDFTPEQVAALGTTKDIIIKAYAIQAQGGVVKSSNELTAQMTSETGETAGLAEDTSTTTGNITSATLGQYVNLGTDLLGTDNTTSADWRVFSKDANGAWLILADYLPVGSGTTGASVVSNVGLATSGTYGVKSTVNRADLITKLNGDWSELLTGSDVTGLTVKGAVSVDQWKDSWNANDVDTTLYTKYENPVSGKTFDGWYIGNAPDPTTINISLSSDKGYDNTLYFPHKSDVSGCYGYWLASPSADNSNYVWLVGCSGSVGRTSYGGTYCGVCPAVYLPSSISLNTTGTVWSVAE